MPNASRKIRKRKKISFLFLEAYPSTLLNIIIKNFIRFLRTNPRPGPASVLVLY